MFNSESLERGEGNYVSVLFSHPSPLSIDRGSLSRTTEELPRNVVMDRIETSEETNVTVSE